MFINLILLNFLLIQLLIFMRNNFIIKKHYLKVFIDYLNLYKNYLITHNNLLKKIHY